MPLPIRVSNPSLFVKNDDNSSLTLVSDRLDFEIEINKDSDLSTFTQNAKILAKKYSETIRLGIVSSYTIDVYDPGKWFSHKIFRESFNDITEVAMQYNRKSQFQNLFKSNKVVFIQQAPPPITENEERLNRISIQIDINTPPDVQLENNQHLLFFDEKMKTISLKTDESVLL